MSGNRARTVEFRVEVSKNTPVVGSFASFSTFSTRAISAASTLTVDLPDETCTAGDSPKKFGSMYIAPSSSATAITMYFQSGYRFMSDSTSCTRRFAAHVHSVEMS